MEKKLENQKYFFNFSKGLIISIIPKVHKIFIFKSLSIEQ